MTNINVFVYGTLKRGFSNHRLLANSIYLGEEILYSGFIMYSLGGYPCVTPADPEKSLAILGEVYKINEQTLVTLDYLEGYPGFYDRKIIQTKYGDTWIYFISQERKST